LIIIIVAAFYSRFSGYTDLCDCFWCKLLLFHVFDAYGDVL